MQLVILMCHVTRPSHLAFLCTLTLPPRSPRPSHHLSSMGSVICAMAMARREQQGGKQLAARPRSAFLLVMMDWPDAATAAACCVLRALGCLLCRSIATPTFSASKCQSLASIPSRPSGPRPNEN